MRITWGEEKSRANLAKHKVSLQRARLVFEDPRQLSRPDPFEGEARWRTLGLVNGAVVLFVVHTSSEGEDGEEGIRIISARKATAAERKAYENPHAKP